jgi:hypothetical protein
MARLSSFGRMIKKILRQDEPGQIRIEFDNKWDGTCYVSKIHAYQRQFPR